MVGEQNILCRLKRAGFVENKQCNFFPKDSPTGCESEGNHPIFYEAQLLLSIREPTEICCVEKSLASAETCALFTHKYCNIKSNFIKGSHACNSKDKACPSQRNLHWCDDIPWIMVQKWKTPLLTGLLWCKMQQKGCSRMLPYVCPAMSLGQALMAQFEKSISETKYMYSGQKLTEGICISSQHTKCMQLFGSMYVKSLKVKQPVIS